MECLEIGKLGSLTGLSVHKKLFLAILGSSHLICSIRYFPYPAPEFPLFCSKDFRDASAGPWVLPLCRCFLTVTSHPCCGFLTCFPGWEADNTVKGPESPKAELEEGLFLHAQLLIGQAVS